MVILLNTQKLSAFHQTKREKHCWSEETFCKPFICKLVKVQVCCTSKIQQNWSLHVCSKKKTVLHSIELWWTSLNKFCTQVCAKSWQLTANVAPQGLRSHFGGFFKGALVAAVFCCCSCCCCWAWWIWDINGSSTSKELITYNAKGFFLNTETPFQRLNDKQLYINEHCTNNDFDLSS